jgi:hypothetical protein
MVFCPWLISIVPRRGGKKVNDKTINEVAEGLSADSGDFRSNEKKYGQRARRLVKLVTQAYQNPGKF